VATDLAQFLRRRSSEYFATHPPDVVAEVKQYLRSHEGSGDTREAGQAERYWTSLPAWLLDHPRFRRRAPADPEFLRDVLWGQYCLFLVVRMHDDLLDGQARSPALVFVADSLLVESERSFARHLQGSAFWSLYRTLLDTTLRAVLAVDALQRRPGGLQPETVSKYSEVAAIFKVGSAAVCAKCRRMDDFVSVRQFADHLAVANQIVDDVRDVQEDLDRGRFNFAAAHFGLIDAASPSDHRRAIAQSVLLNDGMGSLIDLIKGHYQAALSAVRQLRLDPAIAFVERACRDLELFAGHVHRSRVRFLLAPAIPSLDAVAALDG
jgi:hypothetical protein